MNKQLLIKFSKFGAVGLMGMVVDFSVTYILKELLGVNKYIANSSGFIIAATSNFLLNRKWTFKSNDPKVIREFSIFTGISIAGLIINNAIIWLLHDRMGLFSFYLSKLFAIGVVFFWNFFMNHHFNFGKTGKTVNKLTEK